MVIVLANITKPLTRVTMVFMATLLLLGCDDAGDKDVPSGRETTLTVNQGRDLPAAESEWLGVGSYADPMSWLWHRESNAHAIGNVHRRTQLKEAITRASHIFGEKPRMIANRAVQLEKMLADIDRSERAIDLIINLTNSVGAKGSTEGFGATSQQYFQLRQTGRDKQQALTLLRKQYGHGRHETSQQAK